MRGGIIIKLKIFQKGFNYSQDGDGNRLVYHLQGCNMGCPWCANPEGMASDIPKDNKYFSCEAYELEVILEEIKRSEMLFYDGGGITLSGGEVTLQFEAVKALLSEVKGLDIHTAIETNGTHPRLQELFNITDLLIMDFKHYDNERHREMTGIDNHIIKENIEKALRKHPRVLIRTPLIKGFNDSAEDAEHFAAFFRQYPTEHVCFELLPYHEYGLVKWEQCGMPYTMKNAYISTEMLREYKRIFEANKLSVITT